MAIYVKNSELFKEIVKSKQQDELTPKAIELLQRMIKEISKMFTYSREEDREDVQAYAMVDVLLYWRGFKPEKSTNAFSYYTQTIKNGTYKGWKKLYPEKASKFISTNKENGIYNFL